jgi:hypothetical protein
MAGRWQNYAGALNEIKFVNNSGTQMKAEGKVMQTVKENADYIYMASDQIESYGDAEADIALANLQSAYDVTYPLVNYLHIGTVILSSSPGAGHTIQALQRIRNELEKIVAEWQERKDPDKSLKDQIAEIIRKESVSVDIGPFSSRTVLEDKLDIPHTLNNLQKWYIYYLNEWKKAYPDSLDS